MPQRDIIQLFLHADEEQPGHENLTAASGFTSITASQSGNICRPTTADVDVPKAAVPLMTTSQS